MKVVLQFEDVVLPPTDRFDHSVSGIRFQLSPGECLVVEVGDEQACPPLADVAQGLLAPVAGVVRIEGDDWSDLSPEAASERRHRIGRVFEEQAWLSNLDVDENITLAHRHHTNRPTAAIRQEAQALATRFGLAALPAGRPAWTSRHELTLAQWVRALLGDRCLYILEQPTRDVTRTECDQLVCALREAREAGASVLWLTHDRRIIDNPALSDSARARLLGDSWEILK